MRGFNSILYVTESSVRQEPTLARAVSLAENNQADLTVIEVVPNISSGFSMSPATGASSSRGDSMLGELQEVVLDQRKTALASMIEPYRKHVDIRQNVLEGKVSLEAIRTVLRDNHDLLIKPAENPSYTQRLFGSDDMQLLRSCPCPVWLTREDEKSKYRTILAAVDFELDSTDKTNLHLNEHIAELSSSLAVSDFAALHFIHVWDALVEGMMRRWSAGSEETVEAYVNDTRTSHEKVFREFHEHLQAQIGKEAYDHIGPQFHLRRGVPATTISASANELQADLLVMGTVARTGIAGWLVGNTAEAVLEQVQCSVLAIKPRGFVSPVKLAE